MRLPSRSRSTEDDADPMTSMIDVVFLLLVFFICASIGSVADRLLPANLQGTTQASPTPSDTAERWEHPPIRIRLQPAVQSRTASAPDVLLDDQPLADLNELRSRLTQLATVDPSAPVVLSIHDDIRVQDFVSIYDLCQRLKLERISFAVNQPAKGATPDGQLP
ncbi:MAG: ExbD/TolR family protein [Planctomycetota bacterium]